MRMHVSQPHEREAVFEHKETFKSAKQKKNNLNILYSAQSHTPPQKKRIKINGFCMLVKRVSCDTQCIP